MKFAKTLLRATTGEFAEMQRAWVFQLRNEPNCNATSGSALVASHLAIQRQAFPLMMAFGSRMPEYLPWLPDAFRQRLPAIAGRIDRIRRDLVRCGADLDTIERVPLTRETEVLLAYVHDYISRVRAIGYFGFEYVFVRFAQEFSQAVQQRLCVAMELPDDALQHLAADLSGDTGSSVVELLDRLVVPADRQAVVQVARRVFYLFRVALDSLPGVQR